MAMMPMLMGLDSVWRHLQSLEADQRRADRHSGYRPYSDHDQEARTGRVDRVRSALFFSGVEARNMLAERLSGIGLSSVIDVLLDACKDVALCWGGSVLAGGAVGGALGAVAGGVGAVPGAAIGAGLGAQIGAWVLGLLGLKGLIEDLGTALPEALRHYEAGLRMAWGPVRRWDSADSTRMGWAAHELALGHVLLMTALLSALAAYLTRGRGDPAAKARILQDIRTSPRLGPKVADWVAVHGEALARHPGLKPKQHQVVMASPAKPSGPYVTPSQLRKARGQAGEDLPAPKKSDTPTPPKVMPQKKVRCFEPNDLPAAKIPEFDRQLAGQERGLNDMTVGEYLKGRDAFTSKDVVRDPGIARQARTDFQAAMQKDLERDLMRGGMSPRAAKEQAALRAKAKMETLAALHNPDMVSAGKDAISDFGDKNVNSRIGAQWKSRVADLDEATKRIPEPERATTKMNARLQRCP